jgi:hypothetical protein
MPLLIFPCAINQISGPTNFALLSPTKTLLDLLGCDYMPMMMMLGDVHSSIRHNNICDDNAMTTVATFESLWFRLLDSLACKECPIDYSVESFFHPKLLCEMKTMEQAPFYLDDKRLCKSFKEKAFSPMNYLQERRLPCFSNTSYGQSNCFTQNIRYHFVDIRLTASYQNLSYKDKERIHIMNHKMLEGESFQKAFTSATNQINGENAFAKYFRPLIQYLNRNDKLEDDSSDSSTHYHATLEQYLMHVLQHVFGFENWSYSDLTSNFFGIQVLDLANAIVNDPDNFIEMLTTLPQFKTSSMLGKQMINKQTNEVVSGLKDILVQYNRYCHTRLFQQNHQYNQFKEIIHIFTKHRIAFRANYKRKLREDEFPELDSLTERLEELFNFDDFDELVTDIMIPFMDMYYLFRSWKQTPSASISIYNAGAAHTATLWSFLKENNYYDSVFATGDKFDNQVVHKIQHNHTLSNEFKSTLKKNVIVAPQCVQVTKDIDLTQLIQIHLNSNPSLLNAFNNKVELNKTRYRVLGEDIYIKMLKGHPITNEQLEAIKEQHVKNNTIMPDLQLTSVNIPLEYKQKRMI